MKKGNNDGFVLLEKIKTLAPTTAVLILTSATEVQKAVKAMQMGALDYITKPYDADQVTIKIDKIADRLSLQAENARLRNELYSHYEILGISPTITELKRQITLVAKTESRVLITGPNGSGKELVARAIHSQSKRANKPFIVVNCAAIPENLIESELFGTVKGAFTDANSKKGQFDLAHEGTIFLDEIGDMSPATQAKVLRVLENGEFTKVGGERSIKVDVRVIAATNKNLSDMIRKNLFREDLFYRLNVITIHTTPLRLRKEDIPILIAGMLKKMGKTFDIATVFTNEAIDFMKSLEWAGNVRELNNAVERIMIFWNQEPLGLDQVSQYINVTIKNTPQLLDTSKNFKEACACFERDYIKAILDEYKGNIADAAERLGLQRPYLYEKMKKLEIDY
jgi:two-component system nitrogen regulation response regulator NtrX